MDSKGVNQETATSESLPELLGRMAKSSAVVVHDEIDLFLQQLREKARAIRSGVLLVATGVIFGATGLLSLCAASIMQLSAYMAPVIAALVTGVSVALIGLVIVLIGYGKLKHTIRKP